MTLAIGTFGMVGLDRLLGLQAQTLLEKIIGLMEANFFKDPAWIELLLNLSNSLNPIENVIAQVFFCLFSLYPNIVTVFEDWIIIKELRGSSKEYHSIRRSYTLGF